jgi:Flp pilus assembly protein TadG
MRILTRFRSHCGLFKRVASEERGAALVETALVMPILMTVIFGMIEMGIMLNNYMQLTNAVAIGGEVLAVDRGNTTDPCADASNAVLAAAPGLNPANLTFTVILNGVQQTPHTGSISCSSTSTSTGMAANLVQGKSAVLRVTSTFNVQVPGFGNITSGLQFPAQITELVQ